MQSHLWPLQMFDLDAEFTVVNRRLPHWAQAGTVCFLTWRTIDSIPGILLRSWHGTRDAWLRQHDIEPRLGGWQGQLQQLDRDTRGEFTRIFSERWHRHLDEGHGACVLRQQTLAKIVADSLHYFDGERYELTDFIVMPNHVHVLAAFVDENGMLTQCESWKHYAARQINRNLGTKGRLWQQDGFDHLVRSVEHFERFRRYIADNPRKARLRDGEYLHYSKKL